MLKWFVKLVSENHDLQVRFRWENPNDVGEFIHQMALIDENLVAEG